ncbi:hypothetical protein DH2020_042781 [Rehmannia glutinosa]|uniref:Uncharacterized protein n=1 Tax=Rehmannia glutinosa TaxID=99300 RepID=A0ABR0UMU4_REHGL
MERIKREGLCIADRLSQKPNSSATHPAGGAQLLHGHLHLMPGDSSRTSSHKPSFPGDKYGPIFTIRLCVVEPWWWR